MEDLAFFTRDPVEARRWSKKASAQTPTKATFFHQVSGRRPAVESAVPFEAPRPFSAGSGTRSRSPTIPAARALHGHSGPATTQPYFHRATTPAGLTVAQSAVGGSSSERVASSSSGFVRRAQPKSLRLMSLASDMAAAIEVQQRMVKLAEYVRDVEAKEQFGGAGLASESPRAHHQQQLGVVTLGTQPLQVSWARSPSAGANAAPQNYFAAATVAAQERALASYPSAAQAQVHHLAYAAVPAAQPTEQVVRPGRARTSHGVRTGHTAMHEEAKEQPRQASPPLAPQPLTSLQRSAQQHMFVRNVALPTPPPAAPIAAYPPPPSSAPIVGLGVGQMHPNHPHLIQYQAGSAEPVAPASLPQTTFQPTRPAAIILPVGSSVVPVTGPRSLSSPYAKEGVTPHAHAPYHPFVLAGTPTKVGRAISFQAAPKEAYQFAPSTSMQVRQASTLAGRKPTRPILKWNPTNHSTPTAHPSAHPDETPSGDEYTANPFPLRQDELASDEDGSRASTRPTSGIETSPPASATPQSKPAARTRWPAHPANEAHSAGAWSTPSTVPPPGHVAAVDDLPGERILYSTGARSADADDDPADDRLASRPPSTAFAASSGVSSRASSRSVSAHSASRSPSRHQEQPEPADRMASIGTPPTEETEPAQEGDASPLTDRKEESQLLVSDSPTCTWTAGAAIPLALPAGSIALMVAPSHTAGISVVGVLASPAVTAACSESLAGAPVPSPEEEDEFPLSTPRTAEEEVAAEVDTQRERQEAKRQRQEEQARVQAQVQAGSVDAQEADSAVIMAASAVSDASSPAQLAVADASLPSLAGDASTLASSDSSVPAAVASPSPPRVRRASTASSTRDSLASASPLVRRRSIHPPAAARQSSLPVPSSGLSRARSASLVAAGGPSAKANRASLSPARTMSTEPATTIGIAHMPDADRAASTSPLRPLDRSNPPGVDGHTAKSTLLTLDSSLAHATSVTTSQTSRPSKPRGLVGHRATEVPTRPRTGGPSRELAEARQRNRAVSLISPKHPHLAPSADAHGLHASSIGSHGARDASPPSARRGVGLAQRKPVPVGRSSTSPVSRSAIRLTSLGPTIEVAPRPAEEAAVAAVDSASIKPPPGVHPPAQSDVDKDPLVVAGIVLDPFGSGPSAHRPLSPRGHLSKGRLTRLGAMSRGLASEAAGVSGVAGEMVTRGTNSGAALSRRIEATDAMRKELRATAGAAAASPSVGPSRSTAGELVDLDLSGSPPSAPVVGLIRRMTSAAAKARAAQGQVTSADIALEEMLLQSAAGGGPSQAARKISIQTLMLPKDAIGARPTSGQNSLLRDSSAFVAPHPLSADDLAMESAFLAAERRRRREAELLDELAPTDAEDEYYAPRAELRTPTPESWARMTLEEKESFAAEANARRALDARINGRSSPVSAGGNWRGPDGGVGSGSGFTLGSGTSRDAYGVPAGGLVGSATGSQHFAFGSRGARPDLDPTLMRGVGFDKDRKAGDTTAPFWQRQQWGFGYKNQDDRWVQRVKNEIIPEVSNPYRDKPRGPTLHEFLGALALQGQTKAWRYTKYRRAEKPLPAVSYDDDVDADGVENPKRARYRALLQQATEDPNASVPSYEDFESEAYRLDAQKKRFLHFYPNLRDQLEDEADGRTSPTRFPFPTSRLLWLPECDLPFEECEDVNCLHYEARLLHDEHQAKVAARAEAKRVAEAKEAEYARRQKELQEWLDLSENEKEAVLLQKEKQRQDELAAAEAAAAAEVEAKRVEAEKAENHRLAMERLDRERPASWRPPPPPKAATPPPPEPAKPQPLSLSELVLKQPERFANIEARRAAGLASPPMSPRRIGLTAEASAAGAIAAGSNGALALSVPGASADHLASLAIPHLPLLTLVSDFHAAPILLQGKKIASFTSTVHTVQMHQRLRSWGQTAKQNLRDGTHATEETPTKGGGPKSPDGGSMRPADSSPDRRPMSPNSFLSAGPASPSQSPRSRSPMAVAASSALGSVSASSPEFAHAPTTIRKMAARVMSPLFLLDRPASTVDDQSITIFAPTHLTSPRHAPTGTTQAAVDKKRMMSPGPTGATRITSPSPPPASSSPSPPSPVSALPMVVSFDLSSVSPRRPAPTLKPSNSKRASS